MFALLKCIGLQDKMLLQLSMKWVSSAVLEHFKQYPGAFVLLSHFLHFCHLDVAHSMINDNVGAVFFQIHSQSEAAAQVAASQRKSTAELFKNVDLSQYKIQGSEDDWKVALNTGSKNIVSLKRLFSNINIYQQSTHVA